MAREKRTPHRCPSPDSSRTDVRGNDDAPNPGRDEPPPGFKPSDFFVTMDLHPETPEKVKYYKRLIRNAFKHHYPKIKVIFAQWLNFLDAYIAKHQYPIRRDCNTVLAARFQLELHEPLLFKDLQYHLFWLFPILEVCRTRGWLRMPNVYQGKLMNH